MSSVSAAAALYFNFTALLSDLIPVTTFSSRQSSVEWISDGSHLTPIVLSPVILERAGFSPSVPVSFAFVVPLQIFAIDF